MERTSFVLYTTYADILQDLTMEEMGYIFKAILVYKATGKIIDLPKGLLITFRFIKNQLDMDELKYKTKIEKLKANGLKGGRPKKQENKNQKAKGFFKNHNDNVNVNDNVNENDNENDNENENDKKEIKKEKDLQAQQPPAIVPSKPIKPHQRLYNYFAAKYKQATGIDYLGKSQDFVALATLEKKFGIDMVKQKIDWFYIGCKNAVFWFTKDINDFVIGKLQSHWNEIIPKLTEEQKQQQKENEEREKHKARLRARGIEC